jgi:hypothetical protein
LCRFHYLREAAKPVYEADRHAKKELKKHLRGVRPMERSLEQRNDAEAGVIRGYCLAVRSALTDDGRPPLEASGLKLHKRIPFMEQSFALLTQFDGVPYGASKTIVMKRGVCSIASVSLLKTTLRLLKKNSSRKNCRRSIKGEGSDRLGGKRDEEKRNGELAGSQRSRTCHGDEVPILCYDDRKPNGICLRPPRLE